MGQFPHHPASARERSSYFATSLGDDEDPFLFVSQGESEDVREASLTDGGAKVRGKVLPTHIKLFVDASVKNSSALKIDDVIVRMEDTVAVLPHAFSDENELPRQVGSPKVTGSATAA
jgi:hypothetical protein